MNSKDIHDKACQENRDTYIDPFSGSYVFTAKYLARRGYCCENGCRHCPYSKAVISN